MAMQARPKILYIVGAGRSGSTILDIALGNSPEICSSGELVRLPERGWLDDQYCACGERVNRCAFWRDVKSRWIGRSSPDAIDRRSRSGRRPFRFVISALVNGAAVSLSIPPPTCVGRSSRRTQSLRIEGGVTSDRGHDGLASHRLGSVFGRDRARQAITQGRRGGQR